MDDLSEIPSYLALVRHSHDLAEILKRLRPHCREQVVELQCIVTFAHAELDELAQLSSTVDYLAEQEGCEYVPSFAPTGETAAAFQNLQLAYQSLTDLKHALPLLRNE